MFYLAKTHSQVYKAGFTAAQWLLGTVLKCKAKLQMDKE